MPDTPILTRNEYKTILRETGTGKDDAIDALIPMVQVAFQTISGRSFGKAVTASQTRSYAYDGSGYCDIDDAATVTEVVVGGRTLADDEWVAMPYDNDVDNPTAYWWLEDLPTGVSQSPEMGFLQNWDVLGVPQNTRVEVTGTWGWPMIPLDIKMAAIWTLNAWLEMPGAFTTETIESYSRSFNLPSTLTQAIPVRASMILEAYDRGPVL